VQLLERLDHDHRVLVAAVHSRPIGVIEIRAEAHVSLLFVDAPHQRQGVARALLRAAFPSPSIGRVGVITVNATPNSVGAYQKLGFTATPPEQVKNGIRFVPMELGTQT